MARFSLQGREATQTLLTLVLVFTPTCHYTPGNQIGLRQVSHTHTHTQRHTHTHTARRLALDRYHTHLWVVGAWPCKGKQWVHELEKRRSEEHTSELQSH